MLATPLSDVLEAYIADSLRRHAANTTQRNAQVLKLFRDWMGPNATVANLSWQTLSDYHQHLSQPETGRHLHKRGATTLHKHLQTVESVWNWAWKRQARGTFVGVPQPDSLELKRPAPETKIAPTWAEMDAAIGCADGWQHDLYVLLRCTGLRVSQALGLRWEDLRLDQEHPVLHIRPELGKSAQEKRGRWVPVAPVLAQVIAGWGRREGFLLPCPRLRREARARDAQRAWTRAGVDSAVWSSCAHHAFRAGFVSGLKVAGADDEAVEHLVGHSRGIRDRYADPFALPLLDAVALIPPIGESVDERKFSLRSLG